MRAAFTRLLRVFPPRSVLALPVLALALLAAGCGAESRDDVTFDGAQAEVADVVADLQTAAEDEDPTRICRALLAGSLSEGDCTAKVRQAIDDTDQFALDVREVDVEGDAATARVITGRGDAERTATMRFTREGTSWRITAFE